MPKEYIEKQDTLNDGREKLNRSIDRAYNADEKSNTAVNTSNESRNIAQTAEDKADSVQSQFNQVVIEGDSSVESAQARVGADGTTYSVLKERLDTEHEKVSTKLDNTANSVGFNVSWYALEVENDDWTPVIQKTLDLHGHAVVSGKLNVMGTVMVRTRKYLEITNDAELIKPETADNTDPVVWVNGSHAVLRGHNKHGSFVRSRVPTPFGVVTLGYKGMNDTSGKNVLYSTIENLGIRGHKKGGEETGDWSVVLGLFNPQVNGLASYFHSISNLLLADGNVGMLFEGWANANIVDDIQFINTGNQKWLGGGALVLKNTDGKVPLDNILTNMFHHQSVNADTLVFDGGGNYNTITNIVSEQGGTLARWIYEKNQHLERAYDNIITGISNVNSGSSVGDGFWTRNSTITNNAIRARTINAVNMSAETLKPKQIEYGNEAGSKMGNIVIGGGLKENTTYEALRVRMGQFAYYRSFMVEINISFYSPIPGIRGTQKAIFEIDFVRESSETTVRLLFSVGSRRFIIEPIINGYEVLFGFRVANNGTNTTNQRASIDYKVTGDSSSVITQATENVIVDVPSTLINNATIY